jgi:hypothetical protein
MREGKNNNYYVVGVRDMSNQQARVISHPESCTYFSTTRANENWPSAVRTYAPSNVRCAARISTSLFTRRDQPGDQN